MTYLHSQEAFEVWQQELWFKLCVSQLYELVFLKLIIIINKAVFQLLSMNLLARVALLKQRRKNLRAVVTVWQRVKWDRYKSQAWLLWRGLWFGKLLLHLALWGKILTPGSDAANSAWTEAEQMCLVSVLLTSSAGASGCSCFSKVQTAIIHPCG